jgi:hypothetical protein
LCQYLTEGEHIKRNQRLTLLSRGVDGITVLPSFLESIQEKREDLEMWLVIAYKLGDHQLLLTSGKREGKPGLEK